MTRKRKWLIVGLGALTLLILGAAYIACRLVVSDSIPTPKPLTIVTWNVRGYPEKDLQTAQWFHHALAALKPDVVCIQEIANQDRVFQFLSTEGFSKGAFQDSRDGQDNAIFVKSRVGMTDTPDPNGFQHPAQEAYIYCGGFDAVVITVHLSWSDVGMREQEKKLLSTVVTDALRKDPDVIVVGDFNTTEQGIQELATATGLRVMVPIGQDGVGTTHAGNRYDHFLISPDLADEEAIDCTIQTFTEADLALATTVSDHLPVVARFKTRVAYQDRTTTTTSFTPTPDRSQPKPSTQVTPPPPSKKELKPETPTRKVSPTAPVAPVVSTAPRLKSVTVYITRTGEKYHLGNCSYLSQEIW